MPTRRLTSNLCVWYPKRLSRITSFHHIKDIIIRTKRGKRTDKRETFKLIHKTVFPIVENRIKETSKGQKEVWTAINGEVNIKGF